MLFPSSWVPKNWMVCDGRRLKVSDYQALAVVLGYDKDDDYFSLPRLDSFHSDVVYIICHNGLFPVKD